jgi:hypothetical protein
MLQCSWSRKPLTSFRLMSCICRHGDVVGTLAWNTTRHLESWCVRLDNSQSAAAQMSFVVRFVIAGMVLWWRRWTKRLSAAAQSAVKAAAGFQAGFAVLHTQQASKTGTVSCCAVVPVLLRVQLWVHVGCRVCALCDFALLCQCCIVGGRDAGLCHLEVGILAMRAAPALGCCVITAVHCCAGLCCRHGIIVILVRRSATDSCAAMLSCASAAATASWALAQCY